MSLVVPEKFQHILRILNTNIDGRIKVMLTICNHVAGGTRKVPAHFAYPQYQIPDWFLNRQKDIKDGKFSQVTSNQLENKLREDLERLKKIRAHRGLRHYWGLRVRGQHTKTTGRRGRTVGVSKKK